MEPALTLSICIAVFVIALTGYAIYTAFGPASTDLRDPFEEHEDYHGVGDIRRDVPRRVSDILYFLRVSGLI